MKEYGGYIELERMDGPEYHEGALALNCGRNCLIYLKEVLSIRKIYLPYFICSSVTEACKKCGLEYEFYHIDASFKPILKKSLAKDEYLYVVNYYGQLENSFFEKLHGKVKNLIVDNAQAFFQKPVENVDTIYTCRKFFGVADGAYVYTQNQNVNLDIDVSYPHMQFLMGRLEKSANEFYSQYVENNHRFQFEPVLHMSKLTQNLLKGIDYEKAKQIRTENFSYVHERLKNQNQLDVHVPEGAFMYPFYVKDGYKLRKKLQALKIYIPTLWPDVFEFCQENDLEYDFAKNILPLPVDQRYSLADMEYIVNTIEGEWK